MKTVVTIVYDTGKGKLRATCNGGWVRFPNALRREGAKFKCEIREGSGGSFIAVGQPEPMNAVAKRAVKDAA